MADRFLEGWVWGWDIDSKQASIACVRVDSGEFVTHAARWRSDRDKISTERSLAACRLTIRRFAALMREQYPPCAIAYELPVGRHPKPTLLMHAGVVVENILDIGDLAPFSYTPSDWKRRTGMSGAASKEAIEAWALELGAGNVHDDQNQYDALGVAVAAYFELVSEEDRKPLKPARP